MRIAGNVYITGGSTNEVRIESFSNLLPQITTEVIGNTLVIRSESCLEYDNDEASVYITLPSIENVELKSSGMIRVQTVPSAQKLNVNLSGSGTIRYLGSIPKMNLLLSGSGDIILEGFVNHLETNSSGSGRIQGYFLHTDTAFVRSTGSGHQQIWVDKYLDATLSGSGNIYYRGYPNLISTLTSGSGKVINDN